MVEGSRFAIMATGNRHKRFLLLCVLLITVLAISIPVTAAPTTSLHIVKFTDNGTRIVNETTVTREWLEKHLPVYGDGITHYYHQGPVFIEKKEEQWDPGETTNFKDMGAVKGTAVSDLCGMIGGMGPADEVMIKSGDGYHVEFNRDEIYAPEPRQGAVVVCWYNGEEAGSGERQGVGYPPDYHTGMRLVFFADNSTNTAGRHVFGNADMRAVMPPESIHLFDNLYPSTSGYTVKWVDEIRIYEGGYTGTSDALPKSFESKMDETYLPPKKSPPDTVLVLPALLWAGIPFIRRRP